MSPTVGELVDDARRRLRSAPFAPSPREAALLLGRVLGLSEAQVAARDDSAVDPADAERFRTLVERRLTGEPVAYLVGDREFYGRRFAVDDRVLVPRPETEHLVELALGLPLSESPRLLDLGTGSGCLAVTLALELPAATVIAADASIAALAVARRNVVCHGVEDRVALVAGDWATPLAAAFDLVLTNPPYLAEADRPTVSHEVQGFEPRAALFADAHGLGAVSRLLDSLAVHRGTTLLACEIGDGQLPAVAAIAGERGWARRRVVDDYAGKPRAVLLRRHH